MADFDGFRRNHFYASRVKAEDCLAEHTYRVQYSTPPLSADYLMLCTGFYFCAARRLALDAGFDRTALIPDPNRRRAASQYS